MEYDQALIHALDGDAIVFFGAGFSKGATSTNGSDFRDSKELAHFLCNRAEIDDTDDLGDAAEYFLEEKSVEELIELLQKELRAKKIEPYHESLSSIRWRRIYTTNYDDIIETALKNVEQPFSSAIVSDTLEDTNLKVKTIVHINGFIDRLNKSNIFSDFKLSNVSYLTDLFSKTKWYTLFSDDIALAKAIFFVGYSLYDLDLKRLLFQYKNISDKCFFFLGKEPSKSTQARIKHFGTLINKDSEDFSNDLQIKMESYSPTPKQMNYISFLESGVTEYESHGINPSDDDIFSLFFTGALKKPFIYSDITNSTNYYFINRQKIKDCFSAIQKNDKNYILVESDLGNGKTMFLEGIKASCVRHNILCFTLASERSTTLEELSSIFETSEKKVIIIENYHHHFRLLNSLALHIDSKTSLLLSGRSTANDIHYTKVHSIFKSEFTNINLNKLSEEDALQIISLFRQHGLWGKYSSLSDTHKINHIKLNFNNCFSGILLAVLESDDIKNRIKVVIEDLKNKKGYHAILASIFILDAIGLPLELSDIVDLLGLGSTNDIVIRTNLAIKQLVDVRSNTIKAKSSILANFILNKILDGAYTVSIFIKIYTYCCRYSKGDNIYSNITKELGKFSNIQSMLPEADRRRLVIHYFEHIKDLANNTGNPNFWLQYAIAQALFDNFERAKVYFDNAYALAKRRENYNTFQIDNHFARFLLARAVFDPTYSDYSFFKEANTIIQRQIHDMDNRYYPYRVAKLYRDYYQKYYLELKTESQEHFINQCKLILSQSEKTPKYLHKNKSILDCQRKLSKIIRDVERAIQE